jgi:hypothetical protein
MRQNPVRIAAWGALLLCGALPSGAAGDDAPVRFNRDIRPILADKCFHCHGADEAARQADLRLDDEESATRDRDGKRAIVAGSVDESELWHRINHDDPDQRMPPTDEPRQLTDAERAVLRRWIEAGAVYEPHWAFTAPVRPGIPVVDGPDWAHNEIDRFVLAALAREGIAPSPEADRAVLLRRVSLDLTGLPPSPEETAAFLADTGAGAYERLVDRLLSSPRFGERLALWWLDLARYGDSGGYQGDILRSMSPWRDWAISAFNRSQSFDQFTIEQIAGDLLPEATIEQRIATGFHRNHRINDEDGIVHEEFRVEYVADRVETTAAVWMGLTLGCARCHDHKFDPFSQRDYYGLFAVFNSIDESGRGYGNAPPLLSLPTVEQSRRLDDLDRRIADARILAALVGAADGEQRRQQLQTLETERQQVFASIQTVMVLRELPEPRPTFVLARGAYDQPRDPVSPAPPALFADAAAGAAPFNRLALARWLVSDGHPLTTRVTVNAVWQLLFGQGLVRTPEDFGTRGEPPTHPELLDWLAIEFRDSLDWDVKALIRLIVTSATYRQSSQASRDAHERDPENHWLGRGPRFRLSAEVLRDQALAAAGLLTEQLGGASVRPYQPEGLWQDLASADLDYNQGHGADLYRRSLYTFWRRTIMPPAMAALDAPNREVCTVRRPRTNTPLQALVLLNETGFAEASRGLAQRVLMSAEATTDARLDLLMQCVLVRPPDAVEREILSRLYHQSHDRFQANPDAAEAFGHVGEWPAAARLEPVEVAAWGTVASAVLNLDETLTRE